MTAKLAIPSEHVEQRTVVRWAQMHTGRWPELGLLFAVPNFSGHMGNQVTRWNAGTRAKAEGRKKGVPDLVLPVPRAGYHGLFMEMKRLKGGTVSAEQRAWLDALKAQGYAAVRCNGAQAAIDTLTEYLTRASA